MVGELEPRGITDSQELPTHTPPSESETETRSAQSAQSAQSIQSTQPLTTAKEEQVAPDEDDTHPEAPRSRWFAFAPWRWGLRLVPVIGGNPEYVTDGRFQGLEYETVDEYPRGYPSWAAFQNSDSTFRVYRRFGTLRNRVLLYRQQELAELELQLNKLDKEDAGNKLSRLNSFRTEKKDENSEGIKLITEIDRKLKEYDELLERESRIGHMQRAPKRSYRTLVNYLWNAKPIVKREMQFLNPRDDFVLLSNDAESTLEQALERLVCKLPFKRIRQLFASEEQQNKMQSKYYVHLSAKKLAGLIRMVVILLAVLLISVPILFLSSGSYSNNQKRLVVIIAVLLFPIAVELTARPRNHELFAITAAYCAVLTTCLATTNINLSQSQGAISA